MKNAVISYIIDGLFMEDKIILHIHFCNISILFNTFSDNTKQGLTPILSGVSPL